MANGSSANAARHILIAIALVATAVALWKLSEMLMVAFGGIVIATLVRAMAKPFGRIPWLGATARLLCGLAACLIILLVLGWLFGRQVSSQADQMRRLLPEQLRRTAAYLNQSAEGRFVVRSVRRMAEEAPSLGGFGSAASSFLSGVLDIVLLLFLGVFFAWNPGLYVDGSLRLLPPQRRPSVRHALEDAGASLRSWLMGQLVSMAIIGTLAGTAYAIIGMPLALALGLLAGLFEFIPVAGPILFGAVAILVGFSKSASLALSAVIVFVILQQIESNIIIPLVQRWAARIPPALTVLSVLAGGILLGPIGIVFAVPLTVVAITLIRHLYVENALEGG